MTDGSLGLLDCCWQLVLKAMSRVLLPQWLPARLLRRRLRA